MRLLDVPCPTAPRRCQGVRAGLRSPQPREGSVLRVSMSGTAG